MAKRSDRELERIINIYVKKNNEWENLIEGLGKNVAIKYNGQGLNWQKCSKREMIKGSLNMMHFKRREEWINLLVCCDYTSVLMELGSTSLLTTQALIFEKRARKEGCESLKNEGSVFARGGAPLTQMKWDALRDIESSTSLSGQKAMCSRFRLNKKELAHYSSTPSHYPEIIPKITDWAPKQGKCLLRPVLAQVRDKASLVLLKWSFGLELFRDLNPLRANVPRGARCRHPILHQAIELLIIINNNNNNDKLIIENNNNNNVDQDYHMVGRVP